MQSAKPVGCDSSVLIAALTPWHPNHARCVGRVEEVAGVPAHALAESFSVMTRLPGDLRVDPREAAEVLTDQPWQVLDLPGSEYERVLQQFAGAGRAGCAIYDGLVAATLKHHSFRLLSADRRAAATYELIGVDYELM